MEAQLSKLKALTETTAKETLTNMAEIMDCIHKVNGDASNSISKLKDTVKEQLLEQKQISDSSIRQIVDLIAKMNKKQDSHMSFVSRQQVHADVIAEQICMCLCDFYCFIFITILSC